MVNFMVDKMWQKIPDHSLNTNCVLRQKNPSEAIEDLKTLFPSAQADEMNFVLFSTSGVHGSYCTIEDIEKNGGELTFLVIHPRTVTFRYGNCEPTEPEDFEFLKQLRLSSMHAVKNIGFRGEVK